MKDGQREWKYTALADGELDRLRAQSERTRAMDSQMLRFAADPGARYVGLDVGCASGDVTVDRFAALPEIRRVVGTDTDAAVLRAARANHPHVEFHHVNVDADDAEERLRALVCDDGAPVIVTLMAVLHQVAAPVRLLDTLRRALPAGSRVVARTFDDGAMVASPDPDGHVQRIVDVAACFPAGSDRFGGRKLRGQFERAGFADVRAFQRPVTLVGLDPQARRAIFDVDFAFRGDLCRRGLDHAGVEGPRRDRILDDLHRRLDAVGRMFATPGLSYRTAWYGAVGRL